jgi:hypothetical protein
MIETSPGLLLLLHSAYWLKTLLAKLHALCFGITESGLDKSEVC